MEVNWGKEGCVGTAGEKKEIRWQGGDYGCGNCNGVEEELGKTGGPDVVQWRMLTLLL